MDNCISILVSTYHNHSSRLLFSKRWGLLPFDPCPWFHNSPLWFLSNHWSIKSFDPRHWFYKSPEWFLSNHWGIPSLCPCPQIKLLSDWPIGWVISNLFDDRYVRSNQRLVLSTPLWRSKEIRYSTHIICILSVRHSHILNYWGEDFLHGLC